ncbi:hypothetical protein D0S45_02200 [Marinifilum sp. JC120]|nr:hypothetical protein D0S45_02200 [Marinifilum sp. JC120]
MTVVSSSNNITFAGDGVQVFFDFNFRIFTAEDLCAVVCDSEGREERLIAGSDFKIVSGLGADSGGRVQYPVSGEPLPAGKSITLYREIPYTQELELVDNDPFSAQLLNEAFDRGVMRDQQLQEQLDRALKYDISTPGEERLSPKEMVQTITTARDDAVFARSGAIEAEGNSRDLLADAKAARVGSEAARDKAEAAQTAAEDARDSAIQIAVGDLSPLRSPAPVLTAPAEAPEGTTVSIVISDYSEDGLTSYEINTLGFGTASISGNTIRWTLETTGADVSKSIEVVRRRRGELYSDAASHQLLVKHIPVQDGPTMAFADSSAGYPGATVNADGVHAPAHSVAAENASQIVSAKPEIVPTGGKLSLLSGTTESVLKLDENYTGPVITDQGEGEIVGIDPAQELSQELVDMTALASGGLSFSNSDFMAIKFTPSVDTSLKDITPLFLEGSIVAGAKGFAKIWADNNGVPGAAVTGDGSLVDIVAGTAVVLPFPTNSLIAGITYWIGFDVDTAGDTVVHHTSPTTAYPAYAANRVYSDLSIACRITIDVEYTATLAQPLPGVPTKAFKNPLWTPLALGTGSTTTELKLNEEYTGQIKTNQGDGVISSSVKDTSGNVQNFGNVDSNKIIGVEFTAQKTKYETVTFKVAEVIGSGATVSAALYSIYAGPEPDNWLYPSSAIAGYTTPVTVNSVGDVVINLNDHTLTVGTVYEVLIKVETVSAANYLKLASGTNSNPIFTGCGAALTGNLAKLATFIYVKLDSDETTGVFASYVATLASPLPGVPTAASKASDLALKVGAGAAGEDLGPEEKLTLASAGDQEISVSTSILSAYSDPYNHDPFVAEEDNGGLISFYSTIPALNTAYFGSGFAEQVRINKIRITPYSNSVFNSASYMLQTSVDGIEWTNVEAFTGLASLTPYTLELTTPLSTSYARLLCTSAPGGDGRLVIPAARWLTTVTASTTTQVKTVGAKSLLNRFTGLHKTLMVGDQLVEVASVSEITVEGDPEVLSDQGTFIHSTITPGYENINPFALPLDTTLLVGLNDTGPSVVNTGYYGSAFAEPTKITGFHLRQGGNNASSGSNQMGSVRLQKSEDGVTWTDVETINLTYSLDVVYYQLSAPVPVSYLRILAAADTLCSACGWSVEYLRWSGSSSIIEATLTLKTPLATAPTAGTVVSIPDRCILTPASYTCTIAGDDLKITGAEIALEDNPALKRLAMAVSGAGVTFKSGKIYIKEKL